MASLLAQYENAEALQVARDLDDKVRELLAEAAGIIVVIEALLCLRTIRAAARQSRFPQTSCSCPATTLLMIDRHQEMLITWRHKAEGGGNFN